MQSDMKSYLDLYCRPTLYKLVVNLNVLRILPADSKICNVNILLKKSIKLDYLLLDTLSRNKLKSCFLISAWVYCIVLSQITSPYVRNDPFLIRLMYQSFLFPATKFCWDIWQYSHTESKLPSGGFDGVLYFCKHTLYTALHMFNLLRPTAQ